MELKKITLTFSLEQVCNDILAKCNLISLALSDDALADIKSNVQEPDNPETRSIICRAITEAFGGVKVAAQRYLSKGRETDNNNLERLIESVTKDSDGVVTKMVYEDVVIELGIPNFNTAVTDHLKSMMHKYVVDYTMSRFLQDQVAEKSAEYKAAAEDDYQYIIKDLNSREKFTRRMASFV